LPPSPPQLGIWAVLHEVRSEYAQLLTTAFLLINGPGKWSLDALLLGKREEHDGFDGGRSPSIRELAA